MFDSVVLAGTLFHSTTFDEQIHTQREAIEQNENRCKLQRFDVDTRQQGGWCAICDFIGFAMVNWVKGRHIPKDVQNMCWQLFKCRPGGLDSATTPGTAGRECFFSLSYRHWLLVKKGARIWRQVQVQEILGDFFKGNTLDGWNPAFTSWGW